MVREHGKGIKKEQHQQPVPICLVWGDSGMIWPKAAELWKEDHKDTKSCWFSTNCFNTWRVKWAMWRLKEERVSLCCSLSPLPSWWKLDRHVLLSICIKNEDRSLIWTWCMGFRAGGTWSHVSVRAQHRVTLPQLPAPAHCWAQCWAQGVTPLPAVGGWQINPPSLLGGAVSLSVALLQIWTPPLNWVSAEIVSTQELPGQKAVSALCLSWAACHPHHQWVSLLSLPRGGAFILFWEPTLKIQLHRSQACCHTKSHRTQSFFFWPLPTLGNQSTPTTAGQGVLLPQEVLSPPTSLFLLQIWISLLCWISAGNDPK